MADFYLTKHVHVCRAGDATILLDLHRDNYIALDGESSHSLVDKIEGWELLHDDARQLLSTDHYSRGGEPLVELEQQGLVTKDRAIGRSAAPASIETPTRTLVDDTPWTRPKIQIRQVFRFALATVIASALLKTCSLERVVGRIKRRKLRRGNLACTKHAELTSLVSAFSALQPFFFTSRDACLFHALALVEFLALSGVDADWVFGVRTPPFSAHCWIQIGDRVLSDEPDRVRRFVPIMVV